MTTHNESFTFLVVCALGVFFSYFFYGILQETITKTKYGLTKTEFSFIKSMLLLQCIVNATFAFIALKRNPEDTPLISQKSYALCAMSYIGAMFSSNMSLRYVSYPTQVVGKSIKPIPVMLLNVFWARKRYPLKKYIFVGMITVGVMLFIYKGNSASKGSSELLGWGEMLLLISLGLDGLTGAMQEDFRTRTKVGPYTMMLNLNLWSILYLSGAILATGEIMPFLTFVEHFPNVLWKIFLFGVVSAIGQMFIYTMVVNFGSLMCSVVTTTRKFFTVLASLIIFGHAMSTQQVIGTVLVFAGLMADQLLTKKQHSPRTSACHGTSATTTSRTRDATDIPSGSRVDCETRKRA